MVLKDELACIREVRPGRNIFIRKGSAGSNYRECSFQLLFVHGLCGTEMQYRLLLEQLDIELSKLNIRVSYLLYDSVGCCQSPALDEWDAYSKIELMKDLKCVMKDHLDKTIPTVFIGHSYAPSIFVPMFRLHHEKEGEFLVNLVGCIFLCTALRFPENPQNDGGHPIMALPVLLLNCLQKTLTEGFIKQAVHPDHSELKRQIRIQSNTNNMQTVKAYHRQAVWLKVEDFGVLQELPTLVVHGADDGIIPIECARKIACLLPKSELNVINNASHLVMVEQPENVSQVVILFLQKLRLLDKTP